MSDEVRRKLVLSRLREEYPNCYFEFGIRKMNMSGGGRKQWYLIVPPIDGEGFFEYYLVDHRYKVVRKICGMVQAYGENSRCLQTSGWGTGHPGVGFCRHHRKVQQYEKKCMRRYLSQFLGTDRSNTFIDIIGAKERVPIDCIDYMERLIANTDYVLTKKLVERERNGMVGMNNRDVDGIIVSYMRALESQLKTLRMIQQESFFSPFEIDRWLDEFKHLLERKKGRQTAEEVLYMLVTVNGLLNKSEMAKEIGKTPIGAEGGIEKTVSSYPLGYSMDDVDDGEFEVLK